MADNLRRILVGPEVARRLLDTMTHNRKLNTRWVAVLADDMKAGRYDETVIDPLRVDSHGRLTDGQHRLQAIIMAGVEVWMWLETTDATTFNLGLSRTAAHMMQFEGVENAKAIESAVRLIIIVNVMRENGGRWTTNQMRNHGIGAARIVEARHGMPGIDGIMSRAKQIYALQPKFGRVFAPTACAAILWFCREDRNDQALGESVMAAIATGDGLSAGDPRYAYRKFSSSMAPRVRLDVEFPALMYVMRCVISGKHLSVIKSSSIGDVSSL